MYHKLIRPLLFLFPPETIHRFLVRFLRIFLGIPLIYHLVRSIYHVRDPLLKTEFLGMTFSNPVGLAAGFDKNAEAYRAFHAFGFSFIEVGTVTPLAQPGNPRPRSFRIPQDRGLINRMGFNSKGAQVVSGNLNRKRPKGLILGGNMGKNTFTPNEAAADDYEAVFRTICSGVDYFVINVSCPNISDLHKLQDQESLEEILSRVTRIRDEISPSKPVLLKISPDLNEKQLDETLGIIERLNLDGIVATNTTIGRTGLNTPSDTLEAIGRGGLSGAPITGRSLEVVRYISKRTGGRIPVIAVGGIMSVEDALNMFDAGATLIQLYTGFIYNGPGLVKRINKAVIRRKLETETVAG